MALPLVVPALFSIGTWLARAGLIGKLAGVFFVIMRIYTVIGLISLSFWSLVTYFAKELVIWLVDFMISLSGKVLELAGVENPGPRIVQLVNQLPSLILDLWARLDVWGDLQAIATALALNMALRSIPLVGGIFRG